MDSALVDEVKRATAAVEAFEKACEELEAAGVAALMRPYASLGLDRAVARGALMAFERRARPIAIGDSVSVETMSRNTDEPTYVDAVGKAWVTTRGQHAGRWSLETGKHERVAGTRIDAVDLVRIRRDLGPKRAAKRAP